MTDATHDVIVTKFSPLVGETVEVQGVVDEITSFYLRGTRQQVPTVYLREATVNGYRPPLKSVALTHVPYTRFSVGERVRVEARVHEYTGVDRVTNQPRKKYNLHFLRDLTATPPAAARVPLPTDADIEADMDEVREEALAEADRLSGKGPRGPRKQASHARTPDEEAFLEAARVRFVDVIDRLFNGRAAEFYRAVGNKRRRSAVSHIIHGRNPPTAYFLLRMCSVLPPAEIVRLMAGMEPGRDGAVAHVPANATPPEVVDALVEMAAAAGEDTVAKACEAYLLFRREDK